MKRRPCSQGVWSERRVRATGRGRAAGCCARPGAVRRPRQEEIAEQRERDPDRADQQVLPGRLERAVVTMEVDERRARQRRRLDGHPQEPEVCSRSRASSWRGNSRRQPRTPPRERWRRGTPRRNPPVAGCFAAEVAHGVDGAGEEEPARDAEERAVPDGSSREHAAAERGPGGRVHVATVERRMRRRRRAGARDATLAVGAQKRRARRRAGTSSSAREQASIPSASRAGAVSMCRTRG